MGVLVHVSSLSVWKPIKPIAIAIEQISARWQTANMVRQVPEILVQRVFLTADRPALLPPFASISASNDCSFSIPTGLVR